MPLTSAASEIYALLDMGCDTTMMSDMVAVELGLCGVKLPLAIGGVNIIRSVNAQYTRNKQVQVI